jgi:elongation factor Ts
MAITAQDVNKLRQMTGAGMMDCKKALTETNGDFDAAIDLLRKTGQKVSASRADRLTNEGSIFIKTDIDETEGVLVALGCETDFVAKNQEFQNLGNQIADLAFENKPSSVDELKSMSAGETTIGEKITELVGKIGEKLEIVAYNFISGEKIIAYVHAGSKLGVLVALKGTNDADVVQPGKDIAMQIAAMNPVAVDKDDVDQTVINHELEIGREQAKAEGKPENIIDKIAEGKLNKFFKENTLLNQSFVKDNSHTVKSYLESINKGLTVDSFQRVSIGG